MELYVERGYEQTTVADIAERAGLTARTFFRYFADKREVLFAGSAELAGRLGRARSRARPRRPRRSRPSPPRSTRRPTLLGEHRDYSRQRQSVIAANAELQERELIKMATLAAALADGLRRRGVAEPDASLAAEAGVAVFRVAFERWVDRARRARRSRRSCGSRSTS